jgi:predicted kinase
LLAFYRGYRALVRAKVTLLRLQQGIDASRPYAELISQYIDLADGYCKKLGPPVLLIIGGLMGTGKSTLAAQLADAFAIESLSTDHIRRSTLGASKLPAGYGEGNYQPDIRNRVYNELLRRADELLKDGQSAVLDGTFPTRQLRGRAHHIGALHGAVTLYVQCNCPPKDAYSRIRQRAESGKSESEARTELYDLQARELEQPSSKENMVVIDTTHSIAEQLRVVYNELRRLIFQ